MAHTLGTTLTEVAAALSRAGCRDARRLARRLVGQGLELAPSEFWGYPERPISETEHSRVCLLVERALAGEPLSRILGRREFWGLDFALSVDTLDPRADSETLVAAVLRRVAARSAPIRILDLGTGSGCLLLALLSELPRAVGVGVDIAPGAAATARTNATALGLAARACFFVGAWGGAVARRFEVIIANPPYVARVALPELPRAVREYDPWRALDGGVDGLDSFRILAADVRRLLAPQGIFATEVGKGQAEAVAAILESRGLTIDGTECDLAGITRCVVARTNCLKPRPAVPSQKIVGMCDRAV